ncbi:30S ribosomal protein S27ae [Candidatus Woesearchaeota archaeon]|nr:30S ribosomal protein S27ae [Candidatus Woesearchaeota archaeon]
MADKKKDAKKSEGPIKKHTTSNRQKNYESGKAKNRFCPKCGPGVMLADHKDRLYCGKCHYMEKK